MKSNPLCKLPHYEDETLAKLPGIEILDGSVVVANCELQSTCHAIDFELEESETLLNSNRSNCKPTDRWIQVDDCIRETESGTHHFDGLLRPLEDELKGRISAIT